MKGIILFILSSVCAFIAGYCAAAATPEAKGWLVSGFIFAVIFLLVLGLSRYNQGIEEDRRDR